MADSPARPATIPLQRAAGTTPSEMIGAILARLVVPAWVLAGALFKLYERDPKNLPSVILAAARAIGFNNLDQLLRLLIGCELFAVGVMLFLPRFARAMAIFMLSCFCAILIGELYRGATKCGCFGSLPFKPWHMLLIDGSLLVAVIVFRNPPRRAAGHGVSVISRSPAAAMVVAMVIAACGMAIALLVPAPAATVQKRADNAGTMPTPSATGPSSRTNGAPPAPPQPADPTVNPNPKPLPSNWYTKEKVDTYVGKSWRELEIFQLMPRWPRNMDKGKHYVIFYSRTCEHCETLLKDELLVPLDGPITLVEIPQSKTVMTDPGAWKMPPNVEPVLHPEMMALPLGTSWLIETPLVIALNDGKVTTAAEGEGYKKCLGLQ